MAGIHRTIKKYDPGQKLEQKVLGKNAYDEIHPLGTMAVEASDAKHAAEAQTEAVKNQKVIPIADDAALLRARRRAASQRNRGRASTILGSDAETLG